MTKSTQGSLAIGFLILSVLLLIFVQQPLAAEQDNIQQTLDTIRTDLSRIADERNTAQDRVTEIEEMSAAQKRDVANAISATYAQDDLIEDIVALSERNVIDISSMAFTKDGDADVADLYLDTITVGLRAPTQRQFIRFLEALEKDARIYRIKKITADYASSTIDTSLLLETYHF